MELLMKSSITSLIALGVTLSATAQWANAECPCERNPQSNYQMPPMPAGPDRMTAAPSPGTLGRTYYLPSRDIPASKHPRIAMIDIIVPDATSVRVVNMYVHREEDDVDGYEDTRLNGLWRFETLPLLPGIPHIYKVIFRFSDDPTAPETVRYVRLIPGRIIELTY
ncbi:MAG TPA: hypothetical protein DD473_08870 [Planctomycetaceae bacterium]|nr:hypothetical protein [Planctomycetaceae bacterium]